MLGGLAFAATGDLALGIDDGHGCTTQRVGWYVHVALRPADVVVELEFAVGAWRC